MGAAEKFENIHRRLTALDYADQSEGGLLSEAYEALIQAYQESRDLNLEMEELLKDWMHT